MTPQDAGAVLSPTHRDAVRAAYAILEQSDFVSWHSEAAGRAVSQVLRLAPALEAQIMPAADRALRQAATVAVHSLDPRGGASNASFALAGAGGALSGFFGVGAVARLIANAGGAIVERGASSASAPMFAALVNAVAPRFGVIASERAAASALPVLGALGGATLNLLFVPHFERAAHAHFTIRRLERLYGPEVVHSYYRGLRLVAPVPRARRR